MSSASTTVWNLAALEGLAAPVSIVGQPRVFQSLNHGGVAFDGRGDCLVIRNNPLAGACGFHIEAVFRQEPGGEFEQRFLHIQVDGCDDRLLLETRMGPSGTWYADTYVEVGGVSCVLADPMALHRCGTWSTLSLTCQDGKISHAVDGVVECRADLATAPFGTGKTSLGARLNRVSWFRGAIASVTFLRAEN